MARPSWIQRFQRNCCVNTAFASRGSDKLQKGLCSIKLYYFRMPFAYCILGWPGFCFDADCSIFGSVFAIRRCSGNRCSGSEADTGRILCVMVGGGNNAISISLISIFLSVLSSSSSRCRVWMCELNLDDGMNIGVGIGMGIDTLLIILIMIGNGWQRDCDGT